MKTSTGLPKETGIHSLAYLEQLYADFKRVPDTVSAEWREYFAAFSNGNGAAVQLKPSFKPRTLFGTSELASSHVPVYSGQGRAGGGERLAQLIHNHRVRGHIIAGVDPHKH